MRQTKTRKIQEPTFLHEEAIRQRGYTLIAGVDEAGRGPLAGPVVAAAVILPANLDPHLTAGIRDSKQLSEAQREHFYPRIMQMAKAYAVAQASPREIEALDIRKASLLAMKRAVEALAVQPDFVLVDGRDYPPGLAFPGEALIRGDERSVTVGAASVMAKVIRDRIMTALHKKHPLYGLAQHKGYPTEFHRLAVQLLGVCDLHRKTFGGVKEYLHKPVLNPHFEECLRQLQVLAGIDKANEFLAGLFERTLTDHERSYLEQSVCHLVDELKRRARKTSPTSVDQGHEWETYAADFLEQKGYILWERNYRVPGGEIDLVVNKGSQIIFVEVKSKSSDKFGKPYEMVTAKKQKLLIQAAERYLYQRGFGDGWDIRYDVISILAKPGQPPQVDHFEDAIRVEEKLG